MAESDERQSSATRFHRFLDIAVIAAAVATVPTVSLQVSGHGSAVIVAIDWLLWAVFAVELAAGGSHGSNPRFHRVLSGVIVVTSFPLLPDLLSVTRLTRLARLLRVIRVVAVIGRAAPALRATLGRTGFLYVAGLVFLVVVASAGLLAVVEPETAGFWEAIWWAMVTTATVGYGDITPVSLAGRVIGVALMICGISLIAAFSATVAAYFVEGDSGGRLKRIEERLERIEQALGLEGQPGND